MKGRRRGVGFPTDAEFMVLWSQEQLPMSPGGKRRVDVGAWREVLPAVPRAVAWILKGRWEGPPVGCGRTRSPGAAGVHHGLVLLVDLGAEKAPAKAALRFGLQGGHFAWKKLIQLFVGAGVPASGRHPRPRPLATQTFHI